MFLICYLTSAIDAYVEGLVVTPGAVDDLGFVAEVEALPVRHAVQLASVRCLSVGYPAEDLRLIRLKIEFWWKIYIFVLYLL